MIDESGNTSFDNNANFAQDYRSKDIINEDQVKVLGIELENIKIPKHILSQVRGYKVYYAKRKQEDKTILGQSVLNPMYLEKEYLGRCIEAVGSTAAQAGGAVQNLGQLQSIPEDFWSKDPWPRDLNDYPSY